MAESNRRRTPFIVASVVISLMALWALKSCDSLFLWSVAPDTVHARLSSVNEAFEEGFSNWNPSDEERQKIEDSFQSEDSFAIQLALPPKQKFAFFRRMGNTGYCDTLSIHEELKEEPEPVFIAITPSHFGFSSKEFSLVKSIYPVQLRYKDVSALSLRTFVAPASSSYERLKANYRTVIAACVWVPKEVKGTLGVAANGSLVLTEGTSSISIEGRYPFFETGLLRTDAPDAKIREAVREGDHFAIQHFVLGKASESFYAELAQLKLRRFYSDVERMEWIVGLPDSLPLYVEQMRDRPQDLSGLTLALNDDVTKRVLSTKSGLKTLMEAIEETPHEYKGATLRFSDVLALRFGRRRVLKLLQALLKDKCTLTYTGGFQATEFVHPGVSDTYRKEPIAALAQQKFKALMSTDDDGSLSSKQSALKLTPHGWLFIEIPEGASGWSRRVFRGKQSLSVKGTPGKIHEKAYDRYGPVPAGQYTFFAHHDKSHQRYVEKVVIKEDSVVKIERDWSKYQRRGNVEFSWPVRGRDWSYLLTCADYDCSTKTKWIVFEPNQEGDISRSSHALFGIPPGRYVIKLRNKRGQKTKPLEFTVKEDQFVSIKLESAP